MSAVFFGVCIGLLVPLQTSVNARLRSALGSILWASLVSFLVGALVLLIVTVLVEGVGWVQPSTISSNPSWIWLGGVLRLIAMTGNILLFPRLGSVQTALLPITGQVLTGLVIDHFGWFHSTRIELDPARVVGAVLLMVGVLGVVGTSGTGRRGGPGAVARSGGPGLWLWRVAGVGFGLCTGVQIVVNGRLGVVLGSAVAATLVSFLIAATTVFVAILVTRPRMNPGGIGGRPNPPWMWFGGLLGAPYVLGLTILAPLIGTGLTVMVSQIGMMLGSLCIDRFGLLGAPRRRIAGPQLLGVVLMVMGVILIRAV